VQKIQQIKNPEELKEIRESRHKKQNNVCPILKCTLPIEEMVLDHQHKKKKSDEPGIDGGGICRGVIQRQVNALEGKISNSFVRLGLSKFGKSLPDVLRNMADYLENPPMFQEEVVFIHPSDKNAIKRLSKSEFNIIIKYWDVMYPGKKKPEYPKITSKKKTATPKLSARFETYVKKSQELHAEFKMKSDRKSEPKSELNKR